MKQIFFIVIMCSVIAVLSCNSSLSDTEFDDPSLIRPVFYVVKTIDNGARVVEYTCDIYDKNLALVSLKNGSVKIGSIEMGKRTYFLGGEEYYLSGENEILHELNKKYTFTITLSDGGQYQGIVTTQSVDLYQFSVPASHNKTQNMTVSWMGTDPNASMYINMSYNFHTDTSSGTGSKRILIPNPSSGIYTINSSEFYTNQGTMTQATLTLVSEVEGTTDTHFRSGSEIYSQLSYTRKVTIN